MRRVCVITSASGNGGTTFAPELAGRLGVPFYELDALFWKPDWMESSADELRRVVEPIAASDAWVVDGSYHGKLGDLVRFPTGSLRSGTSVSDPGTRSIAS